MNSKGITLQHLNLISCHCNDCAVGSSSVQGSDQVKVRNASRLPYRCDQWYREIIPLGNKVEQSTSLTKVNNVSFPHASFTPLQYVASDTAIFTFAYILNID